MKISAVHSRPLGASTRRYGAIEPSPLQERFRRIDGSPVWRDVHDRRTPRWRRRLANAESSAR